jgi:hypothetical protein
MGTLDKTFSRAVREQFDYRCAKKGCEYCGNQSLRYAAHDRVECAHYYNRYRSSGRWHPDNCAALCHQQHVFLEHNKALEVKFFEQLIGKERHDALLVRHQRVFRYKPWERAEMNRHYADQLKEMERMRMDGVSGILTLLAWD